MYLKSIKLDGFKSFANKTTFEFKKGITAIVGPNGSGKSNIVDAVRWVLGEQSLKSLRGSSSMSDVIFSGSETRDKLNKASVTLTFDNSDKFLNTEFLELEVKRTIYRTGESDYFINNSKVRLKDIYNLFLDSNSGLDSFNIISQGSVTDIVNAKPNERRVVIESAAGVLKYKKRKEESIKKLDKTKENLNSINLIINELENTINPLKEQVEVAKKYNYLKDKLQKEEVALITNDITTLNNEYNKNKKEEDKLNDELLKLQNDVKDNKIEKIKLDIYKTDDEINNKNKILVNLIEQISNTISEKRILEARTKLDYNEDSIKINLINLKEDKLKIDKDITITNDEINILQQDLDKNEKEKGAFEIKLNELNQKNQVYSDELNNLLQEKFNIENRIEILEANILNNEKMPFSVKSILNNPLLQGIHNTIGNLIDVTNEYAIAVNVILNVAQNFIVVDNEKYVKNAINYLKEHKLGRATFLPMNIIKSRYIDNDLKERLKQINGYIGILSELVKYDSQYQNIIENQMGNIIVVKDIDAMNLIAKIVQYKYRIVALDGSVIYAGGAITGGISKNISIINTKTELDDNKIKLDLILEKITKYNKYHKDIKDELEIINNKLTEINNNIIILNTKLINKQNILTELNNKYTIIKNDIEGINSVKDNKIDQKLDQMMEKINNLDIDKEKLEQQISLLKDKKENLSNELEEIAKQINSNRSIYNEYNKQLNDLNVSNAKINVKLDNLLLTLNEKYNMTYEYAKEHYNTPIDFDACRREVNRLKREINSLGEVNVLSINEYERLNTRYEFLSQQKKDLETSSDNLLAIIDDMDKIMIDKFKDTFNKANEEFSKIFKIMFQGGIGKLYLTMPNDYLNTGIDLIICPPGKKIQNLQSLSGGEKSLAAICLLFAILNISNIPFVMLDEVESALDEINVDLFGEYLNKKKYENQYILITHKKRMMEYADVLYGITMEDAGISKIVGVKLENN